jgi:hypothetical protein
MRAAAAATSSRACVTTRRTRAGSVNRESVFKGISLAIIYEDRGSRIEDRRYRI